jgi:hypothetical protein
MPEYILDMLELPAEINSAFEKESSDHRYFYEIQTAHFRTLMVSDLCSQRSYTSV